MLDIVCYICGGVWLILLALFVRFCWRMSRPEPGARYTTKAVIAQCDEAPLPACSPAFSKYVRRLEAERRASDARGETENGVPGFASAAYHRKPE